MLALLAASVPGPLFVTHALASDVSAPPPTMVFPAGQVAVTVLLLGVGLAMVELAVPHADAEVFRRSLGYPIGLASGYAFVWGYTMLNLASALLIDCVAHGRMAAWLLDTTALRYLGTISYGLYVFHFPFQSLVAKALPDLPTAVQVSVQLTATVVVAALSYKLWEAPVLGLKERWFPATASSSSRVH